MMILPLIINYVLCAVPASHALVARQNPGVVSSYGLWNSIGCITDASPNRILHHTVGGSNNMTVETCLDACQAGGFALGGVENARECYCGNSILYNYGPSTACTDACSGNSAEICGGSKAIETYQYNNIPYTSGPLVVVQSYNGYKVTECWQDDEYLYPQAGGHRLLQGHPKVSIPADQMTVERCIDGCAASYYTSAGVEWGQQCFCGNVTFPPGQSDPWTDCTMPCLGNSDENCGDSNRLIIYTNLPGLGFR